jgi:hypothetical protein
MPVTLAGIELPVDIQWVDEFSDHGVGQEITPLLTGHLLVEETVQPEGRPMSLRTGPLCWVERTVVEALYELQATALEDGETLPLVWADGRTFDAVIDRGRGGFSAQEIRRLGAAVQLPSHKYEISISLIIKES